MGKVFLYRFCLLGLVLLPVLPACAQGKKNLPKILDKAITDTPAFQRALLHAQAAQQSHAVLIENDQELQRLAQTIAQSPVPLPALKPAPVPAAEHLSAREWLEKLEVFTAEKHRFPRRTYPGERRFADAVTGLISRLPKDNQVGIRLRELRALYPAREKLSAQERLEQLERFIQEHDRFPLMANKDERQLLNTIGAIVTRLPSDDPIVRHIKKLRELYPRKSRGFPPSYWLEKLEEFVAQNDRFPGKVSDEEYTLYIALNSIISRYPDDDLVVQRIRELRQLYPSTVKKLSPEQWLEKLKLFVQENGTFPRQSQKNKEERSLRLAVNRLLDTLPEQSPILEEMRQLREQYDSTPTRHEPSFWLKVVEDFVQENGHFPQHFATGEEKRLHTVISHVLWQLPKNHPIARQIRELREICRQKNRRSSSTSDK